jgi:ankyrin repeat protein
MALHWAVHHDHYDVAKLLLDYGASPKAESDTRATPVSMAKTGMMQELLEQYKQ